MNVFYYCYSYQLDGKQEQELLFSMDEMLELPQDLEPVLSALNSLALDVDQEVQDRVMAYACQS